MQRNSGGSRDPFFNFGDPFRGFGGFGRFAGPTNLTSSLFSGRDPFDDPFFTRPFGDTFGSSFFSPGGSPFADMNSPAFTEDQPQEPMKSRGLIMEELNSDEEKEESGKEKNKNLRKHCRLISEAYVEGPDDAAEEKRNKHLQYRNEQNGCYNNQQQPQANSFTFHSSIITYGATNGAYYTSSKARRMGSDGITFEESKEANTATGQATHRISRGVQNKGHSLTRKLNSTGRVDTIQTLHNLNEVSKKLEMEMLECICQAGLGISMGTKPLELVTADRMSRQVRVVWALPSTECFQQSGRVGPDERENAGPSHAQHSKKTGGLSDTRDESVFSRENKELKFESIK